MNILIICSKKNYGIVPGYKEKLESAGHIVYLPNCMNDVDSEKKAKEAGKHIEFKQRMYKQSEDTIQEVDAVLVVNPERNGIAGYIGGATFLEMYDAFKHNKKIYLINKVEQSVFADEVAGFGCKIIDSIKDIT